MFIASLAHTQQELDDGAGLREYCTDIYAEVVPEKRRWLQAIRSLPSITPSSVAYFGSSRLRQRIKQAAQKISFDAVIVHCAFAAQYALEVPAKFRLMDFGDLDSVKWLDYSKWRSFPLSWGYYLEGNKLRRYEKQVAAPFDHCTLTTQGELEEFKKLNVERPCSVIPNGVDGSYFHPNGGSPLAKPLVIFLGRMDYYPNIDGVLHFTENVFPGIRAAVPNVEFRIIGSNPTPVIERLRQVPGVVVTGHVPDVRPYLKDALVSIAPLRMAHGTQNKILESMAQGIPVVATPHAAKGVQAVPGQHLAVAGDANEFARKVIEILVDKRLRRGLSEAGRRQVEKTHVWSASMKLLDNLLAEGGSLSLAEGKSQPDLRDPR